MASTTSPAHRVLTLPELLEQILLYPDPNPLFLSKRTNKTFRSVIASSTKLQRKLWNISDLNRDPVLDPYTRDLKPTTFAINPILHYHGDPLKTTWPIKLALRACVSFYSSGLGTRYTPPTHAVVECTREILGGGTGDWQRMIMLEGTGKVFSIQWYCYNDENGTSMGLRGETSIIGPYTAAQFLADVGVEEHKMKQKLKDSSDLGVGGRVVLRAS